MSKCKDSPTGKHEWVVDVEYDRDNPPTVCEHCGGHKPPRKKKDKTVYQYFLMEWKNGSGTNLGNWIIRWFGLTHKEALTAFKEWQTAFKGKSKHYRLFKGELLKTRNGIM